MGHHLAAQRTARNHPFNSLRQHTFWETTIKDLICGAFFDAARIASMPIIDFGGALAACQFDFLGINDDHMITAIHIRCIARLMLAAQAHRQHRSQAA